MNRLPFLIIILLMAAIKTSGQDRMTPELLWKLGRIAPQTITNDGKVIYKVTRYNVKNNKSKSQLYRVDIESGSTEKLHDSISKGNDFQVLTDHTIYFTDNGQLWKIATDGNDAKQLTSDEEKMNHIKMSPDGKKILFSRKVKLEKVLGKDIFPELTKTSAHVYTDLMYRHWDKWSDGTFNHVFYAGYDQGKLSAPVDIMEGELYNTPQLPFGGGEDFLWSPRGDMIIYVSKKKTGKEDAVSTNTDIYSYDLKAKQTKNITEGMPGYDVNPAFSKDGQRLAWASMKRDGYEADKSDIVVMDWESGYTLNLTGHWDGTVGSFEWSEDGKNIYFTAPVKGTIQLFSVAVPANLKSRILPLVRQLTDGGFDITGIVGEYAGKLVLTRTDMNHAAEVYTYNIASNELQQLTKINDAVYNKIKLSKIEKRWVKTTDGKEELVWVIFPPDFDASKKYPALLYCQGGPQSEVSQFYSFRWNFQLMAANGYIVVAPNRRGLPGFGTEWNEAISKDWGGQPIDDYLSAIDAVAQEPYVDRDRLGCVGASYGGYSVFMLAGIHRNRFKTFIAHDGLFDLRSWYGTTEELWFANWDIGGNYWDKDNAAAQRSYRKFSPSGYIDKWNTPIMIVQGGIDYRVPIEQGLQAFQAAQLKGIKSKLLYFPDENHWVLQPQNGIVWQREFFEWLRETL